MRREYPRVSIEECPLFQGITALTLERLKQAVHEKAYPEGSTIFYEGDPASELYLLAAGEVELSYTLPNDATVSLPISRVLPGELFAFSAALGGTSLTAKAHAAAASDVYTVPADRFAAICDDDPASGLVLMRRLATIVRTRLCDTRAQLRWLQNFS